MSNYVEKEGKGTLFVNDYKTTEKHPDMKGTFTFKGVQHSIAAWKQEGKTHLSLSVEIKQKKEQPKESLPFNDDLPEGF